MAFEKGHKKKGGRQAGTPNKASNQVKEVVESLLTDPSNVDRLKVEFSKLSGRDFLKAWTDLMPYVVPRLQSASLDIDLDKLSPEQIDELYEKIMKQINQQL